MKFKFFLTAALVALCIALAPAGEAAATDPIQKITLPDLEKMVSETGEKVVLINFFASWCGPCRMEIPDFKELRGHYPEDKVLIWGVSLDANDDDLKNFAAKSKFNYPVFQDKGDIAEGLRISSIPQTLLIGKDGKVELNAVGMVTKDDLIRAIDPLL